MRPGIVSAVGELIDGLVMHRNEDLPATNGVGEDDMSPEPAPL